MAYIATLGASQQLAIANFGTQTQINLTISNSGQQQSQTSSFGTGQWISPPELFNVGQGFVWKINTQQGSHYVLVQQNSISIVTPPSDLSGYPTVNLKDIPDPPQKPVDFKPIQPMKTGKMSMDRNSTTTQMGNRLINFDNQAKTTINQQFCGQCGMEAKIGDLFCRNCGHELNQ